MATTQEILQSLVNVMSQLANQATITNTEKTALLEYVESFKTGPILGGNLNVNDKEIVSATDGNIVLRPDNQTVVYNLRAARAPRRVIGATHTLTENDDGLSLFSDSSSAVAITMLDDLPTEMHFVDLQAGDGLHTYTAGSGENINGESTWTSQGKGKAAYFVKTGPLTWSVFS